VTDTPEKGGDPLAVQVVIPPNANKGWKERALDWIFAQGSVAIVLIAWLLWTIYDSAKKEEAGIDAARARIEWEQQLFTKIDGRFSEISADFRMTIKQILDATEKKAERDEHRFDKIIDKIKGI